MKKIILIITSIIVTILLSVFIVKKVKSELLKIDIANSIKSFLNEGKYCNKRDGVKYCNISDTLEQCAFYDNNKLRPFYF